MAEIVYVMGLDGHRFTCRGTDMAYVGGEEAALAHGLDVMERGAEEDVAAGGKALTATDCLHRDEEVMETPGEGGVGVEAL